MKPHVLLTRPLFPEAEALLRSRTHLTADRTLAEGALVQLTDRIDAAFLDAMPRLRVVSQCAVGVDNIDLRAARERGVTVMNTPGVLTEATADHTFALLLAAARRVLEGDRVCRSGVFPEWDLRYLLGADLRGRTLGIVGPGRIGRAVARRARGFGLSILCAGRTRRSPLVPGSVRASLPALLARSDFVTLHLPASPATRHMIGERELARMKPGSILINTSRGSLVDEAALVRALALGRPGAAALDVFEREPHVPAGLRRLPCVVLTPHIASATPGARQAMAMTAVRNLLDYFSGRPRVSRIAARPAAGARPRRLRSSRGRAGAAERR